MVTPIQDQQPGLWLPAEMSIHNTDTHLVATSIPISGACHSTRGARHRLTTPPPHLCPAAASAESMGRADRGPSRLMGTRRYNTETKAA